MSELSICQLRLNEGCADVTYHAIVPWVQTLRTIAREGCRRSSAAVGNVACDWSVGGAYCGETERRILVNYLLYPPVNYAKQNHYY